MSLLVSVSRSMTWRPSQSWTFSSSRKVTMPIFLAISVHPTMFTSFWCVLVGGKSIPVMIAACQRKIFFERRISQVVTQGYKVY